MKKIMKKIKVGDTVQFENNGIEVIITKIVGKKYYYNLDCWSYFDSLTLTKTL